jgi:hypothetical protein
LQGEDASFYATTMFVRFRRQARRLQVGLVQNRRVAGKVHAEHIGALGSVDAAVSVRGRLAFWAKLPQRLAALGNRVGPDEHARIYAALHARVPMVTPDEQRAVQEEYFSDETRLSDVMRDTSESFVEGYRAMIAAANKAIANAEPTVALFAADAAGAVEKLAKLRHGESVSGGLGKRRDLRAELLAAGFTAGELNHLTVMGKLTDEEIMRLLVRINTATEAVRRREARRILQARNAVPR